NVLSALRVDGVEKATATRAVGLGAPQSFTLTLQLPGGATRVIDNQLIAGNEVAIGLGSPANSFVEPTTPADGDLDSDAARFLYGRAAAYSTAWSAGEDEFGSLLNVQVARRTPSLVLVENQLTVEESAGVRTRVLWKGIQMDADLRTAAPVS